MSKSENPTTETTVPGGVIAKLRAHKEKAKASGENSTSLPETQVDVTWPAILTHGLWMKAQRLSKKSPWSTADYYVVLACKFDGERLTMDDFQQLIPTNDALHLLGEVMGDDEDDAGNV